MIIRVGGHNEHMSSIFSIRGSFALAMLAIALPFLDVPGLASGAYVKPLVLPVAGLILAYRIFTAPFSVRFPTDKAMKLALLIMVWAILGALIIPVFSNVPFELKGQTLPWRIARDLFALFAGFIAWIAFRIEITDSQRAVIAMRIVLGFFILIFVLVIIQTGVAYFDSNLAIALDSVVKIFRAGQQEKYYKVFGLAPEASMLADQLL